MSFRANQKLRENMRDYRHKLEIVEGENAAGFIQSTADYGTTALNLVQHAAEIFSGMENHLHETEARAQSLCQSLAEKLQLAEEQRDSSERARRKVINEFNGKLQDLSRALQQARSRITEAEERATAAEFRAQAAETQLGKANGELAAIEKAIRTRLL